MKVYVFGRELPEVAEYVHPEELKKELIKIYPSLINAKYTVDEEGNVYFEKEIGTKG